MTEYTTRMGLIMQEGPEEVDVKELNENFKSIDKYMGCMIVNDGVTPPNEDLFDGVIVRERTSGIAWVALANGAGGFAKRYINYPLKITLGGVSGTAVLPSDQTYRTVPLQQLRPDWSVNATSANFSGGGLKVPVTGLYLLQAGITLPSAINAGNCSVTTSASPSGASSPIFNDMLGRVVTEIVDNNQSKTSTDMTFVLTKDQVVVLNAWQNSGGSVTPTGAYLVATLLAATE